MAMRDRPISKRGPQAEQPDIDLSQHDLVSESYGCAKSARSAALRVKELPISERPRERSLQQVSVQALRQIMGVGEAKAAALGRSLRYAAPSAPLRYYWGHHCRSAAAPVELSPGTTHNGSRLTRTCERQRSTIAEGMRLLLKRLGESVCSFSVTENLLICLT
jgi:hypothetical protein